MSGLRTCTFILVTGLATLGVAVLPGCATRPPEFSEAWQAAQRAPLTKRAEARWAALIKGDADAAYAFTTPDYRTVVSAQQHRGKYGRLAAWRMARVAGVSYDGPAVAAVSVEVTHRISLPGSAGESVETQTRISEKWIYKNGDWWYIAN